jgi:hypothetical protein
MADVYHSINKKLTVIEWDNPEEKKIIQLAPWTEIVDRR